LLYFLTDTGARIGEAANLTSDDVFPDSVRVRGKTGERIIPISPLVRDMLLELGEGKLFSGLSHWLSEQVVKAGKRAGIEVRAHDLRRTFATLWRGSDLSLKYIGGWASWKMVEHYSQRQLDKARDDHQQHSPLVTLKGPDANSLVVKPINLDNESLKTVIDLAKELGAALERIKYLESLLGKEHYDIQRVC